MTAAAPTPWLLRDVAVRLEDAALPAAELAARRLGLAAAQVLTARVVRRAVDARKKPPRLVLHLALELAGPPPAGARGLAPLPPAPVLPPPRAARAGLEVAVLGTGPAGMFAALRLVQAGLRPVLLERGPAFPRRHEAVAALLTRGELDPEANLHFGLGGAGTYSDGKLFTRLDSPGVRWVLETLWRHGAGSAERLLVDAQPHVGTDRWPPALESLRAALEAAGCRFRFGLQVTGVRLRGGRLAALSTREGEHACQAAVLAPGNSARELFAGLLAAGLPLAPKPFALGVRMTHPQAVIDRIQHGRSAGHPALGPASYRLTARAEERPVFSFCMCPGGQVVPTPTEPEGLCLNGMSSSARDSGEANAAVVVGVTPADFGADGPLAGVELQRRLERAAYQAGGGGYRAPAERLQDFLAGRAPRALPACGYRPGVVPAELGALLPAPLGAALRAGLGVFCQRLRGLDHPDSLLLGLETRTSSPVRIPRGPDGMSLGAAGLFPAGEGAGYAGGITSSALDGLEAADALLAWAAREAP
ncbi:MAG TPA: FAD-dependent oxidoreductase [Myxococcota bacterium]|nr:FAD-dependent oxidoreductase [Myxococcota bacterium]HRY92080.1 FAD-dependent oxidoreductase [Myxococcota bacterium]